MKKVLSIVLSIAMVVCLAPTMAFAATTSASQAAAAYSDTEGTACEGAVNVLSALKVVDGFTDGTYKPEQTVTRAQMAKLVVTALGVADYATAKTSKYTDMGSATWAIPYVEYASNLNIVNGVGNGKFNPNGTVTYEQAATMIVRALGYTDQCKEMNGTWPAVYIQKAMALNIFEDVVNGGANGANRGDVAIMLYNALDIAQVYADADGATQAKSGSNDTTYNGKGIKGVTMMGTLNKNGTSKYGIVTDADADGAVNNIYNLVGAAGKIVKNKDGKVISVGDLKSVFITGEYNASSKKFKVGDTEYSIASDAYSTISLDGKTTGNATGVEYFVNNTDQNVIKTLAGLTTRGKETYTVAGKIDGKTIKTIYTINKWTANKSAKISTAQIKKITSDKSLLGYDFEQDNNNEIDTNTFVLEGVNSLSDIKEDNIVAVYADSDNTDSAKITKVSVGTKVVSGKVTKVNSGNDEWTIDGTVYKQSKVKGAANIKLNVGDEVKLYLDYDGKVYQTDEIESDWNYAVCLKVPGTDKGDAYDADSTLKVKLFTAAGEEKVFTFKDDDTSTTGIEVGSLVRYKLNTKSEITDIAIPGKDKDNKVTGAVLTDRTKKSAEYKNGVIAGILTTDNTIVFMYKDGEDPSDKDSYDIAKLTDLTDDEAQAFSYFTNSKGDMTAIKVSDKATEGSDIFALISGTSTVKNADDDTVFEITGVADGSTFTTNTKDNKSASYKTDKFTLMKIKKTGNEIKSISPASINITDSIVSDNYKKGEAYVYSEGNSQDKLSANLPEYVVNKKDGDRVQINGAYQVVKNAKVYIPKLDSSKNFDEWTVGSVDDISENDYVVLLQTNKNSNNWDTVICIPETVAKDCPSLVKSIPTTCEGTLVTSTLTVEVDATETLAVSGVTIKD